MSLLPLRKAGRAVALLVFFVCLVLGCQREQETAWPYVANQGPASGPSLTDSIEFLEERLKTRPDSYLQQAELAAVYLQRGRATRSAKDLEQATLWVERSLEEFENPPALLVKAEYLQMEHRFHDSLLLVDKVLALEPGNQAAHVLGVRVELAKGDVAQAEARLQKLPELPLSSLKFLRAQVAEAQGDIEGARALYQEAIQREGDSGSASESARMRALWARLELSQGQLEQAEGLLESARSIPVEQPLTELLRAKLLEQKGELKEASSLLRLAYEQFGDPLFLVRLGEVQSKLGQPEAAQKTFATAAQVLKSDGFGHERDLALALFYLDPSANAEEVQRLMEIELQRREDPETLRIAELVKTP